MPGILTIAKKEFIDHVSDQTFLLCFGILLVSIVASTIYQIDQLHVLMDHIAPTVGFIEKELWKDPDVSEMLQKIVTSQLSTLGVFVAIVLSFNSINKERLEGSLKVLLSYPISKNKIILGKLIAGLLVVTIVVVSSLAISFGIEIYYLSIPLDQEVLLRIAAVTLYGIVLLMFFLSLGTAVSIGIRDASTCLLTLLIVTVALQPDFLALALVMIGGLIPRSITYNADKWLQCYFPANLSWQMPAVFRILNKDYLRFTPVVAFRAFSSNIFHFQNVYTNNPQIIKTSFDWLLNQNISLLFAPLIYMAAASALCFLLFSRREVA